MSYTIQQGDTLWSIAQKILGDGSRWPELYNLNKDLIPDPNAIQVGMQLETGDAAGGKDVGPGGKKMKEPKNVPVDPDDIEDEPVKVNKTKIPNGATVVIVRNPDSSDAKFLYYLTYEWNGVTITYEVGSKKEFEKLFGPVDEFTGANNIIKMGDKAFENQDWVNGGAADQLYGSTESLPSQIEREIDLLGLEDLPGWIKNSPEVLTLIVTGTAGEWSEGRLWKEISKTDAFTKRFGTLIDTYLQQGVTIADAVAGIVADENQIRDALIQFTGDKKLTTNYLQNLIARGWTAPAVQQVLAQAEILDRNPEYMKLSNQILKQYGFKPLDSVGFINALKGHGPPDVIEALNTVAAGQALREAGLDDLDADLLAQIVDTSDRLLTVESFGQLSQELAFNMIRFGNELDFGKLGITEEDLFAAAFGKESPSGKTVGETINLMARFQRDRQAASQGYEDTTAYQDQGGKLRIAGLSGL